MTEQVLDTIRAVIQEDIGQRGLRTDSEANLVTSCCQDFHAACQSIAGTSHATVAIVTGFYIPHGEPPAGETDGPLGALFLARALTPLGIKVILATDGFAMRALEVGLATAGLRKQVPVVLLPSPEAAGSMSVAEYWQYFAERTGAITHLIALERVGPSHTTASLRAQPGTTDATIEQFLHEVSAEHHDRYHTSRGLDITSSLSPAHRLVEFIQQQAAPIVTIGIGDGGNEIGMGKIPWGIIRQNIPRGSLIACRTATDHVIVSGVSNWGAYGLAAGLRWLRGSPLDADLCDPEKERELLLRMVEHGPLVDGMTGWPEATVDGLSFETYVEPLLRLRRIVGTTSGSRDDQRIVPGNG